jgi:hypothetical protein
MSTARSHRCSPQVKPWGFWAKPWQLPSYSPDYNPIEFLWRATKRTATHNRYFPAFDDLRTSVEHALATLSQHPERVKALFGRYLDDLAGVTGSEAAPAA